MDSFFMDILKQVTGGMNSILMLIGIKLGLYKVIQELGEVDSSLLASKTGTDERYIREWLINQAASKVLNYDAVTKKFTLPPSHAAQLNSDDTGSIISGSLQLLVGAAHNTEKQIENFKTGGGILWGENHKLIHTGTAAYFKPVYDNFLVQRIIPKLSHTKLHDISDAVVADIGCGYGYSTAKVALAFPNTKVFGFDYHGPSIARAKEIAQEQKITNISFVESNSTSFGTSGEFNLILFLDCWHDMADPAGSARRSFETLKDDGCVLLMEPYGGENVEDNFTLSGQMGSACSCLVCIACSKASGGPGLGAICPPSQAKKIWEEAGFQEFHEFKVEGLNAHRFYEIYKQKRLAKV